MIEHLGDYYDLLDALLPLGRMMLNKHREFLPYGAVIGAEGKVSLVAGDIGAERFDPPGMLDFIVEAMRGQIKELECRAAGVCVNVSVVDPRNDRQRDALRFFFVHSSGEALDFYFPYRKRLLSGFQFERPFAQSGGPLLFRS